MRFFFSSTNEATPLMSYQSTSDVERNQSGPNVELLEGGCNIVKTINRAKVILGSASLSVLTAIMTHDHLLVNLAGLEEESAIPTTFVIAVASFLCCTAVGWKFAPCMMTERAMEKEQNKNNDLIELPEVSSRRLGG